jgi:hypothetical protein
MSEQRERPPIDWDSIADQFAEYSEGVIEELKVRTKRNADHAQKGQYGVADLLDDVKFFWTTLAESAEVGLDCWRDQVVKRDGS